MINPTNENLTARSRVKGKGMYEKYMNHCRVLLLSAAIALPTATISGLEQSAYANGKNYVKISANAIGQTKRVRVGLNKSMVVDLPAEAHDILVANPEVADAVTRTSRRIYIFAKEVGETNIFIFDRDGNQLLSLDLSIERDVEGLERYIEKYVRGSDVQVEIVNDNIVLTGTVPTPQASAKAVELAQIFVRGGEATTPSAGGQTVGGEGATVSFGQEETRESVIVNLLQIDGEDQVHLKVTVAEIQRSVVKQLGIDLEGVLNSDHLVAKLISNPPFGLGSAPTSGASLNYTKNGHHSILGVLQALDQTGVMRTLAEPSLTAISGESASFRVGGEIRIVTSVSTDNNDLFARPEYETEKVDVGISLAFRPVVLSPGRISLHVATEVSEPTTEGSLTLNDITIPGIRQRQAELPSGGSMVMAGLIKDDIRQAISGYPGLSKVPVLGTLFRSREFQRSESELVIIVTPYLVKPVARQALARPDDNFNAAADGAGVFLGRVNRIYGTVDGTLPPGRYHGNPGFIYK
jgi:pilus assembly protein CpaC